MKRRESLDDSVMSRTSSSSSPRAPRVRVELKEVGNEAFRSKKYHQVRARARIATANARLTRLSSQAIDAYTRVLDDHGADVATLTNLSATYLELGEYELAATTAKRALEENVAWRKGYHRMGVAYEKMGKKREAMEVYRRGLAQCGANAQMQSRLDALAAAIAREDASPEELKARGNAYLRDGDTVRAEETYTLAIQKGNATGATLVALYNNRAEARRRAGAYDAVVEDCAKVLELDPRNLKAILRRGGTYEILEKYSSACQDYEFALDIDPMDPCRVRTRLARCRSLARCA